MDVLLRRFGGEPYVWKKAKFVDGNFMVDGKAFCENEIVSIRNDDRKNYVRCSVCGAYFRKNSKKIEEHKAGCSDVSKCFGCRHMRSEHRVLKSQKYKLLDNGNYISTAKSEVRLYCSRSWNHYDINSREARSYCIHNRCTDAEMQSATGFFLDKPGAFDSIATIDKILEVGYKNTYNDMWNGCTCYYLKGRNNIAARVNKLNIIEGFTVMYYNNRYDLHYSKKYDELYCINGTAYKVWRPHDMPTDTMTYIKNRIAALYK